MHVRVRRAKLYGPFILTAGHCGSVGQTWYQGGTVLGTAAARQWPSQDLSSNGNFDAMLITTYGYRFNVGNLHLNTFYDFEPVGFIPQGDGVGVVVCNTRVGGPRAQWARIVQAMRRNLSLELRPWNTLEPGRASCRLQVA